MINKKTLSALIFVTLISTHTHSLAGAISVNNNPIKTQPAFTLTRTLITLGARLGVGLAGTAGTIWGTIKLWPYLWTKDDTTLDTEILDNIVYDNGTVKREIARRFFLEIEKQNKLTITREQAEEGARIIKKKLDAIKNPHYRCYLWLRLAFALYLKAKQEEAEGYDEEAGEALEEANLYLEKIEEYINGIEDINWDTLSEADFYYLSTLVLIELKQPTKAFFYLDEIISYEKEYTKWLKIVSTNNSIKNLHQKLLIDSGNEIFETAKELFYTRESIEDIDDAMEYACKLENYDLWLKTENHEKDLNNLFDKMKIEKDEEICKQIEDFCDNKDSKTIPNNPDKSTSDSKEIAKK